MMNTPGTKGIAALVSLLDQLQNQHEELHGVIERKIDRMRASDVDGMRTWLQREGELVEAVVDREGLRRGLMTQIGQQLGLSASRACGLSLRQLAERVAEPQRSSLLHATDRLRGSVQRVAQRNRVAGLIAQEILGHFRHVFAAMTTVGECEPGGYTQQGQCRHGGQRQLFDAVG